MTNESSGMAAPTMRPQQFSILIADDDADILDIMLASLRVKEYRAEVAHDGTQALAELQKSAYDLVITDIRMPGMTGVEVAEKVNAAGKPIRVIFITGYAGEDSALRAIRVRPFGYLEKPFSPSDLVALVDEAFEQWSQEQEKQQTFVLLEEEVREKSEDLRFQNDRLVAEQELLQGIISGANFGLIAIDTNKIVHVMNEYAIDILNTNPNVSQSSIGIPLEFVLSEGDYRKFTELADDIMTEPQLREINDVDRENSRERNILAYPIQFRGKITAVVFVVHDITEKQILQKRLLHSAKLASIGELAAGVAHEINNPLGFVTSNLNRLGEYVGVLAKYIESAERCAADACAIGELRKELDIDFIATDLNELLAETHDGLGRVSKIVRDLKTFARADSDTPEQKAVSDLVDDALNLVRNEIKYKLEVVKKYETTPPLSCHPTQLVQVFTNLFINAAQSIAEHGTLKVEVAADDTFIRVVVSDDGCGIPAPILSKIFDPFFTTKEPGKGTGMGLSISYGIIEKHGGTITAESVVGEGTTFTIMLPLSGVASDSSEHHVDAAAGA